MPNYGRDLNRVLSAAGLVMCDPNTDEEDRETIACEIIQIGLDTAALYLDGGRWTPNGGLSSGRKFPVFLAGMLLGRPEILSMIDDPRAWEEDAQAFIVTQADVDAGLARVARADTRGGPPTAYTQDLVGQPEWGIRHATEPLMDNNLWTVYYRQCCTQLTRWGILAVAEAMTTGRENWNHEPSFLYPHRYAREELKLQAANPGHPSWYLAWNDRWTFDTWAQVTGFQP